MDKSFSDILSQAMAGDHDAIEEIFRLYLPLIEKFSIINGNFDEDCKQYILIRIILQISKFDL